MSRDKLCSVCLTRSISVTVLMNLDVNTLFLVTIYVEAILGLLLLFAWVQNTQIHAVAWWGCAHLMRAGSVVLFGMYGSVPDVISIDLANAVLFLAYAVTWTGARVFDGRKPLPIAVRGRSGRVAGRLSPADASAEALDLRFLLASGIITTYTWLTAYEFWRGPQRAAGVALAGDLHAVRARRAVPAAHAARRHAAVVADQQVFGSVWLTVLSFEALLFTISIAFILLAMAKERTEFRHRTAAMVDPLTGIANRRSFLHDADELTKRHAAKPCPAAVLLIDLDHFKSINDRFGHAVGDRVLQIFATHRAEPMRPLDLVGRLGGEEFAAVLYNVEPRARR